MGAVDTIMIAEDKVSQLQGQLSAVENVLESAEEIAVKGKRAGRCFRRLFRLLLLIALVAAVMMVIKKLIRGGSSEVEATVVDEEAALEAAEDAVDEDTDAS